MSIVIFNKKESDSNKNNFLVRILNYLNKDHYKTTGKRIWDLSSAIPCFILLLPLFALVAILIKLDSKGPVFFIQSRVGKNGKPFGCYKFRTMYTGSDKQGCTTEQGDSRITFMGNILRPISIDELPQIINIVKGDMSFIGPRPISVSEFETVKASGFFSQEFIKDLTPKVNPGILGWAIFQGREQISYENRVKLNKEYEKKVSLTFDSYISFLTLKKYWISYAVVFTCATLGPILYLYLFL